MTTTEIEARDAILAHHRSLVDGVQSRVADVAGAVSAGSRYEAATAELVAYIAAEILPHARAEELTIYRAAAKALASKVHEMEVEHGELAGLADAIADAPSGPVAVEQADRFAELFEAHVTTENTVLLPALLADDSLDLAEILEQMHHVWESETDPFRRDAAATTGGPESAEGADPVAAVVSLLLDATLDLARAGHGDRACRLAARAWSSVRSDRPDLGARITTTLHRLARLTSDTGGAAPVSLRTDDPDLDVRELVPAQRHHTIFAGFHALSPGRAFVLVNDHDPKPLRYQFEAEHAGTFSWDYLEAGPVVWRVRIGKV